MKARHEFKTDQQYREYLKTYFSAMAMQGLTSLQNKGTFPSMEDAYKKLAHNSANYADALLKELEQSPATPAAENGGEK